MNATQEEIWVPAAGFEGLYEISDQGRIRGLARVFIRKDGKSLRRGARLLKPGVSQRDGYLRTTLVNQDGKHLCVRVHVLVLESFVGPRPDGMAACHNNGDPSDNRPTNLRWDTVGENNADLVRHGTHWNASKTHCPQDHPYDETNTFHRRDGGRDCRTCLRAAKRRSYAKRKASQSRHE